MLKCRDSLCEQARRLPRYFNTTPLRGVKPGHDYFPFNFQNDATLTKTKKTSCCDARAAPFVPQACITARKTIKTGWRGEASSLFSLLINSRGSSVFVLNSRESSVSVLNSRDSSVFVLNTRGSSVFVLNSRDSSVQDYDFMRWYRVF